MCQNVLKNATSGMRAKEKAEFFIKLSVVRAAKRARLWVAQDGKCHYCDVLTILPKQGATNSGGTIATLDHIITQSNGGTDSLANMVIACSTCNGDRGDMEYNVFYALKKTPGAWKEHRAQLAREKAARDEIRRQASAERARLHNEQQKVDAALRRAAIKMAKEQRIQRGLDKTARNNLIQAQAGKDGIKLLRGFLHRANFEPRKDGHGWIAFQEGSSTEPPLWMDLTGDTERYMMG